MRPSRPGDTAERLAALDLPSPLTLPKLQAAVSARRGRPLTVLPIPYEADAGRPFGAWLPQADRDVIYYEPATSPAHRTHIVLHEIAHILCGHTAAEWCLVNLFPDIDADVVRAMFRQKWADPREHEAELLAEQLRELIEHPEPAPAFGAGPRAADPGGPVAGGRPAGGTSIPLDLLCLVPLSLALGAHHPPSPHGGSPASAAPASDRIRAGRLAVQIRDTTVCLRRYVDQTHWAAANRHLAAAGFSGDRLAAATEAAWMRIAIGRARRGVPPAAPKRLPTHGGTTMAEDIACLRRIAAAYRSAPVAEAAAAVH
ncbi:DUF6545 domain-containing protein [Yinghuangia soli]|uniref:ImmA/IrrE family metallo-endopeptidase n=1 Tax=Yinghuangia soli TaxID=2908204 RepID=A0AA41Q729_9ACTN|nr:DUF6545 domain-containing protein [Yinghuangia soli]MCF2532417.1 ImmA/IrrE family metallo-endopeptidase [Yinghuangia soli]